MTTVRLFAALRAAADDQNRVELDATTPRAIVAELGSRYGEVMRRRLGVASLFVDGSSVPLDADQDLADASEVVLVPPFAGGAGS